MKDPRYYRITVERDPVLSDPNSQRAAVRRLVSVAALVAFTAGTEALAVEEFRMAWRTLQRAIEAHEVGAEGGLADD